MKQRAYQGQSGNTGFDPIAVGYGVLEKQQQRDNEVIRDLENQRAQSQQINEKYIGDLERTFTREEQNRKELKALEDKTRSTREAAIDSNQLTRNRNFKAESKTIDNELKAFEGLAKFSETLGEELTKYQDAKNKADMEDEYAKALAEGLPSERVAETAAMEEELRQAGDATETIADGFAARDVNPEVVMRIRTGNKWRDYGRLKAYAEMAGRSYGPWLEQSLAQLGPEAATPEGRAAAIQQLQMQYLQQNGLYGLSADFLGPMFGRMRESSNGLMEDARRNQVVQQSQTLIDDANTALFVNRDSQSLLDVFNANSTGYGPDGRTLRGNRNGVDAVFEQLQNTTRFSDDREVLELLENTITSNGQSFAQRYPGRVADLIKERRKEKSQTRSLEASERREASRLLEEKLLNEFFNTAESFSDKNLDDAIRRVEQEGGEATKLKALRYKTTESVNREYWKNYLEEQYNNGTITLEMVQSIDVPSELRASWLDRVVKLEKARSEGAGGFDVSKAFTSELKFRLGIQSAEQTVDQSFYGALDRAEAMYNQRFAQYSKTMSADKAHKEAYDEVIALIQEGRDVFAVTPQGKSPSGRSQYSAFAPGANWEETPESVEDVVDRLQTKIEAGEDPFKTQLQGGVSKDQLEIIQAEIAAGRPPRIPKQYMELGRLLNQDPRDILDRQFEAAGLVVPERRATSVDVARAAARDERLQELLNQPTVANQQTVMLQASDYTSPDVRGQSLIAMAGRNGWDPADLAAIFSFETGGTLNPSEPGRGAAAGRIGLIQGGPNERAAYGLGSGNWEREILAIEKYLIDRGAQPGMGLEDLYATVNGGNPGAGNTPDGNGTVARSPETLALLAEHRVSASEALGLNLREGVNPNRDTNYMSPTLAYITDDIGDTSTGEHLDVKQTNREYFELSELDAFVVADDREFGRVTLSEIRRRTNYVGDSFQEHVDRGSHGIDVGTHTGTRIFVRNGARVVSSRATAHGDLVTIKLPDGRMFTFLHGNAA